MRKPEWPNADDKARRELIAALGKAMDTDPPPAPERIALHTDYILLRIVEDVGDFPWVVRVRAAREYVRRSNPLDPTLRALREWLIQEFGPDYRPEDGVASSAMLCLTRVFAGAMRAEAFGAPTMPPQPFRNPKRLAEAPKPVPAAHVG